jgi:tetratricopeptide (TPR) repeat protein
MLDGDSAEAHTSLAHVKATQDWDWAGAERAFQRATSLNPRYPTAHHWYAMSVLVPMGRLDEALKELGLAQSLDPVSTIIARDLAVIHCYRREFDAALEQCDHTIELNPHFSPAYLTLGIVQEQRKEYDEAAAAFERAVRLSPLSHRMTAALGRTLALSGKRPKALKIVRELETLAKTRYVSPFDFASIQLGLGQLDTGFRWLNPAARSLLEPWRWPSIRGRRACSDRRLVVIAKLSASSEPNDGSRLAPTASLFLFWCLLAALTPAAAQTPATASPGAKIWPALRRVRDLLENCDGDA